MRWAQNALLGITLIAGVHSSLLYAQIEEDELSKLNTNIAFLLTAPANPTSTFSDFGWGGTLGAGFNFNQNHAFVGEFLWTRLHIRDKALVPLRLALQNPEVEGHSDLYGFTANYRIEFRGKALGTYFIGGPGFYYRSTRITKSVVSGTDTTCTVEWLWWGATCEEGVVTSGQTISNFASGAWGGNAGIGFTVRIGEEPRYRFYIEARYHYVPHERVKTEVIPITMGVRF
ncbi:MAG: outer membrane beta-barrel protein [Acidobacteriales bacterium]|nr:outer membrane beta-barrel protein [Terriglobales bacterium]